MQPNGNTHINSLDDEPPAYDDADFLHSPKTTKDKVKGCLKTNSLLLALLLSMIVGLAMGLGIRANHPEFGQSKRNLMYFEFPGTLLMRMLKMVILPLIISSLISGMASLPTQSAGKMGGRAILYYLTTTFLAVLLGILLVSTIKPGEKGRIEDDIKSNKSALVDPVDAMLDLVRNAFPENLVEACFLKAQTTYVTEKFPSNTTGPFENETGTVERVVDFVVGDSRGMNIQGIVVFCCFFGILIGRMGEQGRPLKDFFSATETAIIKLVRIFIWYAPVGISFLLAGRILGLADPAKTFQQLGWYIMTVLVGLAIHGMIVLSVLYLIFTRKNPLKLMGHMSDAILTAFGTASSSATLPITMKCITSKARVDHRIAQFMLPVGATINMDGTALYEAVAAIFIAQYNGIELSVGQIITISITATAAAIGAAGVPEAGLVTLVIVLTAVGLPTDDIGLIYAVDWFLDRFRTAINVWGDSVGAGIVMGLSEKELKKLDAFEENEKKDISVYTVGQENKGYIHREELSTPL